MRCTPLITEPVVSGIPGPAQNQGTVQIGGEDGEPLPTSSGIVLIIAYMPMLALYLAIFSEIGFGASVFKVCM